MKPIKEQHRLESGILRGYYFKIKKPLGRNDKLLKMVENISVEHFEDILSYAGKHAKTIGLILRNEHEMHMVIELFPEGTLSPGAIRSNRECHQGRIMISSTCCIRWKFITKET
jgi:hypothetical protein